MNIDEVDFYDRKTKSPAFVHLRTADGGISIGFAAVNDDDFDLAVSPEDARRLGERLLAAANDVAVGGHPLQVHSGILALARLLAFDGVFAS
jgi:2-keto-4-pentenoate hydratase